ncbi:MAG: glycosyltransferase family 2 protein [Thermoleophilia bacterium]
MSVAIETGATCPKVTFGMIVLNGMPFLPHNLRAIYPFAHQIIVVEGALPGAASIAMLDGHSRDATRQELHRFVSDEDPEHKLIVVTAEDEGYADGFWPGEKDEQSQAYARRATGDYLWQVDVDEFYMPADMATILATLAVEPEVTAVTFPTVTIWGDLTCSVDGWFLRRGADQYHRLFKWGPGYTYTTHRPPTVIDQQGRDTRRVQWLSGHDVARRGIAMLHYSLLLPAQVFDKVEYYSNWGLFGDWSSEARRWLADSYLTLRRPYHVHNVYRYPSWLQVYAGPHPPEIERMMAVLKRADSSSALRPMADAQRLLRSPSYALGRELLKLTEPFDRRARRARDLARRRIRFALARLTSSRTRSDERP